MNEIPIGCHPDLVRWQCQTCDCFDGCKAYPKIKYLEAVKAMESLKHEAHREIYWLALQMERVKLNKSRAADKRIADMVKSLKDYIELESCRVK